MFKTDIVYLDLLREDVSAMTPPSPSLFPQLPTVIATFNLLRFYKFLQDFFYPIWIGALRMDSALALIIFLLAFVLSI
jgi:hypothetical protein